MANRKKTKELYGLMLEGFRQAPGNASHAGRYAGVDRKTARNAWDNGWRGRPWARPIKDLLAEEERSGLARAAEVARQREAAALAEQEVARQESIEAAKQEALLLKAGRADVLGILLDARYLAPTMRALADIIRAAVLDENGRPLRNPGISPREAMSLISRHASVTSKAIAAAEALVERGRVQRGEPGQIVGIAMKELDPAEAVEELEGGVELLVELISRGEIAPSPTLRGAVHRLFSLLEPEPSPVSAPRFRNPTPASPALPRSRTEVGNLVEATDAECVLAGDAPWSGFTPFPGRNLDAGGER